MPAVVPPPDHPLLAQGRSGELLYRTLQADRLSPSYLLEGSDEDSLLEVALIFAAAALTGSPPLPRNETAEARVIRGAHPDLNLLTRDKATVISVGALEAMLQRVYATPLEAERQVFLIHPAEAMDEQGLARYLKSLEEPPLRTLFVLLSTRPERLPATVLSRCRRLRIAPPSEALIASHLEREGATAAEAGRVARCAGASLARARRMQRAQVLPCVDRIALAARGGSAVAHCSDEVIAALQRAAGEEANDDEREGDMRREHLRQLLRDTLHALRVDARDAACGRENAWVGAPGVERALELLERLQTLESAVFSNVSPQVIALEAVRALAQACEGDQA